MVHRGLAMTARTGAAMLLLGLLGACGDDADDPGDSSSSESPSTSSASAAPMGLDAAALDGTAYVSTSVGGHDLVDGTAVEVRFEGQTMSVWAGCNTMLGPFAVEGSSLAWTAEPAATMMACEPELTEQDEWLTDLLGRGVEATLGDGTLTLASDEVTVELARQGREDLSGLLSRTWTVIGTVSDSAVSRLPVRTRRPRLDVGSDGVARLFTGCRSGRVIVQVDGTTLTFSDATVQRGRCAGPARQTERAVLALLDGASDNAELHEHLLVVTRGGEGLFFEVR